jgi:hypothetical protein
MLSGGYDSPIFSAKVFAGYSEECAVRHNNPNKNVLFLGNSYTYFNDLPAMVRNLASAAGLSATTTSNTPGGQTLQGHTSTSIGTINSGNWDVVVLQEQSQKPSFPKSYVMFMNIPILFVSKCMNRFIKQVCLTPWCLSTLSEPRTRALFQSSTKLGAD